MRIRCLLIMIICAVLIGYPYHVVAVATEYFSAALSAESAYSSEAVRVELSTNSDALAEGEQPTVFRARLRHDSARLHFLQAETLDQIQSGAFQFHDDGENVTGVYAHDGLSASKLNGVCITFIFSVPEDADPGSAGIAVQIDQTTDWAEHLLPQHNREAQPSFSIKSALSQDASLLGLASSTDRLCPDPPSDIAEYELRVGSNISSVKFQADMADNGAVRINRQSLQRAGETTEIVVTVTVENKKSKSQYLIRVNRAESPVSAEPEENARPVTSSSSEKQGTGKRTAEKPSPSQKSNGSTSSKASGSNSSRPTSSKSFSKFSSKSTSPLAAANPGTTAEPEVV